jgi:hypothetical protein
MDGLLATWEAEDDAAGATAGFIGWHSGHKKKDATGTVGVVAVP